MPEAAKSTGLPGFTIRPFRTADLAAAYALDQVCFPEGIAYSRAEMRYFISRPAAYSIVCEQRESAPSLLAGFLIAGHHGRQARGAAHIVTLDVNPSFRRSGIATALMDEAERHYSELHKETLELEVAVDNQAAQQFYLKRAFVPTGILRGYYDGRLDAISMRKQLGSFNDQKSVR